jgi:glycosyltransferase involved in cell wall biosynthesis
MKRVLLVHGGFPLPVRNGGNMRSWNFVQALKDRHELSLIYSYRRGYEPESAYVNQAKQCFSDLLGVPITPRSAPAPEGLVQRLMRKWAMIPWEIDYHYQPSFAQALSRLIADNQFDFILTRSIYQAQYVFRYAGRIKSRIVVDLDDLEPRKIRRQVGLSGSKSGRLERWRTAANLWTFEQYHRRRLPAVDTCILCSEDDRRYVLARKWTSRVALVPNAIDVTRYTRSAVPSGSRTLLFCATLNYEPNVDAIVWFARDVLPLLQALHADVKLLVVGHKPSADVIALASHPSVVVHADVSDVRPFYEQAAMVIVPIRIAGGTRIKILEAGACRRPVVSTAIGAEGLDLTPGRHCLIANEAADFAQRCSEILTNDGLARRLVDELYRFVTERYDTSVVFEKIRRVFEETDDRSAPAHRGPAQMPNQASK